MKIALIRKETQTTPDWVQPELEQAGLELVDRRCDTPMVIVVKNLPAADTRLSEITEIPVRRWIDM